MKIYQVENEHTKAMVVSRSEAGAEDAFINYFGSFGESSSPLINFVETTLLYDEGCIIMSDATWD